MQVRRGTRTLLAGLAAAAVLAGTAGAAAAADGTSAAKPAGDGAKALCKRVPRIDRRIERALQRIDAGADGRGSLARLEKRIDNAKKAGHTEIATFLQDRLAFRTSLRTNLVQRQKDLADVKTWCQDNNVQKAAG
ncbi:hypothetical protein LK07_24420 [Streptomyces pluripotens]|uniref:Secreted protein n=1 Tax=Streptomyces pluripotens TaxID=1355015 RepID=A0A221P316_9ACTN|nr:MULTISPECIES: hypothetical protein [Streptomyces]ARP72382.1 hypothetical protein LK06_023255 [Streptomyces pluripotens]ASN26631.1 hypothetical protein LK07_24420 [Streptomyces pluripotens]KIE27242.1 hypothetical protein LK08_10015 [Streptomyces sp. MUSC 125]MCH0560047.1 hypothetical protein [Streptomyces sp. MUM 16J]